MAFGWSEAKRRPTAKFPLSFLHTPNSLTIERRAGNPTPNAGLTKQKPTAPTAGTIDHVLGDKKLAYLQQASDGRVHMIRSGTTVQKPLAVKLSLQRLGTFHDKERDGAWYTQEVRSAPDSTQFASRPWLPQRQHPVSLCLS